MDDISLTAELAGDDPDALLRAEGAAIRRAWLDEKFSPTLLPFKEELVESVSQTVAEQTERAAEARRDATVRGMFAAELALDVDRVRFSLASYLRARMRKLEKFPVHFLLKEKERNAADPPLLSTAERAYARGLVEALQKVFKENVTNALPDHYNHWCYSFYENAENGEIQGDKDIVPVPADGSMDIGLHVFYRVLDDLGDVEFGRGEEGRSDYFEHKKGTHHFTQYGPKVEELLDLGKIELI